MDELKPIAVVTLTVLVDRSFWTGAQDKVERVVARSYCRDMETVNVLIRYAQEVGYGVSYEAVS